MSRQVPAPLVISTESLPHPQAKRWLNHVSAYATAGTSWRYILASEGDIKTAKGSWDALRKLAA